MCFWSLDAVRSIACEEWAVVVAASAVGGSWSIG